MGQPANFEIKFEPVTPNIIPIKPPRRLNTIASIKNWERISRRLAPIDIRIPISRVRSVTETSMMFIIPIPPTNNETDAILLNSTVIIFDVLSIVCDDSGSIWVICKSNSYVYKIKPGKKEKDLLFNGTYSRGRNWVGTYHGLKVLDEGKIYLYSSKNGSIDFIVTSLIEDQSGNLWIGTHGNGLYKLDTAGYLKKFYVKDGISLERVMTSFEDVGDGIWIGTRGGGLHRL